MTELYFQAIPPRFQIKYFAFFCFFLLTWLKLFLTTVLRFSIIPPSTIIWALPPYAWFEFLVRSVMSLIAKYERIPGMSVCRYQP